jgi:hypothetical protein
LRRLGAIISMTFLVERAVEPVRVIGLVADEPLRELVEEASGHNVLHKLALGRRSAVDRYGERKTHLQVGRPVLSSSARIDHARKIVSPSPGGDPITFLGVFSWQRYAEVLLPRSRQALRVRKQRRKPSSFCFDPEVYFRSNYARSFG